MKSHCDRVYRARIDVIDVDMLQAEIRQHDGAYAHATAAVQSAIRAAQQW